jgi:hypothetical protein
VDLEARAPCPTDGSDEEWAFVAPYLALLLRENVPQRTQELGEVFNGLRVVCLGGCCRTTYKLSGTVCRQS